MSIQSLAHKCFQQLYQLFLNKAVKTAKVEMSFRTIYIDGEITKKSKRTVNSKFKRVII